MTIVFFYKAIRFKLCATGIGHSRAQIWPGSFVRNIYGGKAPSTNNKQLPKVGNSLYESILEYARLFSADK